MIQYKLLVGALSVFCFVVLTQSNSYSTDDGMRQENAFEGTKFHFEAGANSTAWMNFGEPNLRRITLAAEINGVPGHVVLDSGARDTVISKDFAATLNLRTIGTVTGVGVAGRTRGQVVQGCALYF